MKYYQAMIYIKKIYYNNKIVKKLYKVLDF